MAIIEVKNLCLSFGDKVIFDGANFSLNKGEKMGVVGINGAGKSTLLKILNNEILQDEGEVYINPKCKVGYLDQQALIKSDKTIIDYLRESFSEIYNFDKKLTETYEKMAEAKTDDEIIKLSNLADKILEFLQANNFYALDAQIKKVALGLGVANFGFEKPVKNLSGGQREKVKLAKLLLESPDVILLDEPTNFLDVEQINWLADYLKTFDGTFMLVSHDEKFLSTVANCICDIDLQTITKYNVGFADYLKTKAQNMDLQQKSYDNQQEKIDKMQKLIDRFRYKATKASMVQSRVKVLDKMEKIKPPTQHAKLSFSFKYKPLNTKVLFEAKNLLIGYSFPLLKREINIQLERGEKLAITGFNGIGKSTFLKTISGIIPAISGTFNLATNTVVGYFEQEFNFKDNSVTPLEYILSEFPKLTEKEARSALAKCGITSEHIKEKIKQLSGGEQTKIKICKLTLTPYNILIFDEPTNHIDANAIEQLSLAIKNFEGTVLFVSHDEDFVKNNADRILSFESLLN